MNQYMRYLPAHWREIAASTRLSDTWWEWPAARERSMGKTTIHVSRASSPGAEVQVLLVHGAGGHSGLLAPLAAILAAEGCDVAAPDLPLYGRTQVANPRCVRYQDWIDVLCDLVVAESESDMRPLLIFGASMGGMLAYEVAHRTGRASGIVATCLLDFSGDPAVMPKVTRDGVTSLTRLVSLLPPALGNIRIPVKWVAPIEKMSRNKDLAEKCAADPLGARSRLPLGLIMDLKSHVPPDPARYQGPRVLLVHPAADDWTPPDLSIRFAQRIAGQVDVRLLTNCGHYPIETPGVDELASALRELRDEVRNGEA